jgi:glycosyltransferase involved in cell wall biosynthesis
MKPRLTLITEIIAPYRIPVFNALAARDDLDLHVVFLSETDPNLRDWLVYKSEIRFSYQVLPAFRRRLGKYNLLINRGLAKALAQGRPDAILCGGYNYLASWQAQRWAGKRSIPFLLWLESTGADQRRRTHLVEWLKRRFLAQCQAFVVPGKASQAYLRQFGVAEASIFPAPNAIDNAFFAGRALQARTDRNATRAALQLPDRYFLFVGRLVEAKGVFDLIDAYSNLSPALRSEISLVVVGDGPARHALERRASQVLPGTIHFAGFVQKEDLPPYYALADALVFPTHSDTWGFVVNEAMACGCPVVASDVAGCVPDLVDDSLTGKIVPPHDAPKLASNMEYLAVHEDVRIRMSTQATQRIAAYSPGACAQGIAKAVLACG